MWKGPRTQPQCSTSGNSRGGAREPGGIHSGASSSKGCCESRRGTRKIGAGFRRARARRGGVRTGEGGGWGGRRRPPPRALDVVPRARHAKGVIVGFHRRGGTLAELRGRAVAYRNRLGGCGCGRCDGRRRGGGGSRGHALQHVVLALGHCEPGGERAGSRRGEGVRAVGPGCAEWAGI